MNILYGGAQPPSPSHDDEDYMDGSQSPRNEDPSEIPYIDSDFANKVTDTKRLIYSAVVFEHPENTDEAQDTNILGNYIRMLGGLYEILSKMETEPLTDGEREQTMTTIPTGARSVANEVVTLYDEFLNKNKEADKRAVYADFLKRNLITFPYAQAKESD